MTKATGKAGIPAYLDTISSGLIACKVVGATRADYGMTLIVKVTARRAGPYAPGELLERCSTHFTVPRHAVRKFRSSPFRKILPYQWEPLLAEAGLILLEPAPLRRQMRMRDDWRAGWYEAHITDKAGRVLYQSALHESRDAAAREAFAARPNARTCSTGTGAHGCLSIRWHNRQDICQATAA